MYSAVLSSGLTMGRFGENALMKASFFGHRPVIISLLMDGADVHYENAYNGKQAIHYAAEGNQPEAVKLLLEVRRSVT